MYQSLSRNTVFRKIFLYSIYQIFQCKPQTFKYFSLKCWFFRSFGLKSWKTRSRSLYFEILCLFFSQKNTAHSSFLEPFTFFLEHENSKSFYKQLHFDHCEVVTPQCSIDILRWGYFLILCKLFTTDNESYFLAEKSVHMIFLA